MQCNGNCFYSFPEGLLRSFQREAVLKEELTLVAYQMSFYAKINKSLPEKSPGYFVCPLLDL